MPTYSIPVYSMDMPPIIYVFGDYILSIGISFDK